MTVRYRRREAVLPALVLPMFAAVLFYFGWFDDTPRLLSNTVDRIIVLPVVVPLLIWAAVAADSFIRPARSVWVIGPEGIDSRCDRRKLAWDEIADIVHFVRDQRLNIYPWDDAISVVEIPLSAVDHQPAQVTGAILACSAAAGHPLRVVEAQAER